MRKRFKILILASLLAALLVSGCGTQPTLPQIKIPGIDREARNFGKFSGVTVQFDGDWSFDKLGLLQATGGGNIIPLVSLELLEDRLAIHLRDGRAVADLGTVRSAVDFAEATVIIKFTGGKEAGSAPQNEKTIYVGPNLVNCVGVAPQKCMQIKEDPEDDWKYFYDQIEGFNYEEGYLYQIKVAGETIANAPADSSTIRYKLVEIIDQTPVQAELTGVTWALESLNGELPATNSEITAIFGVDGSLYGSAGCNSYNTSYQVGGETITISPIATTRMSCPQPGVMEQEAAYLLTLESAKEFSIVGYRLTLLNEDGDEIITYLVKQ
jgi:heat shock protein HslJ